VIIAMVLSLIEIFRCIKKDIKEEIRTNENTKFTFCTSLEYPENSKTNGRNITTTSEQTMSIHELFYKVMDLSPLEIYIEKDIKINTSNFRFYDAEIQRYYRGYTREMGGMALFLPWMIASDLLSFCYNNLVILPFVTLRYWNNPTYYRTTIQIPLRRSLVLVQTF